ncbi:hypothetical protein GW17_00055593 [Ensete ventricosum]|nr:hypothetical protein GW17_00055593 [Ensete ventricosum]
MDRPPAGVASHGLATRKEAAGCGQGQPSRVAGYDQGQPVRANVGARKGRQTPAGYKRLPAGATARKGRQMPIGYRRPPTRAAARKGGAYGQKRRLQGLSGVASKGSTRLRPIRRGVVPMEVPPAGAKLAVGAAAPWQGGCRRARQSSSA